MRHDSRIFVAGHRGLVGSAILRRLERGGYQQLLTRGRSELDLEDMRAVDAFFAAERPEYVFLAAAKVGGIHANNTYPADFIRNNLAIQLAVIEAARRHGVRKLAFLGSSCIYPKHAPQPMREEHLLTGTLEPTNQPYAIAKIAGIELCRAYNRQFGTNYFGVMPTNLYGPGDNFDLQNSHVLPALIRKCYESKAAGSDSLTVWGTGSPRREFLYVDDLADACVFLMEKDLPRDLDLVNVGYGEDLTIRELAQLVQEVVGFEGKLVFDASKPDGTPRKLLDSTRIREAGWQPQVSLREGIERTFDWFLNNAGAASPDRR